MSTIRDVMTGNPHTVSGDTSISQAAKIMRDEGIGNVIITDASSGNPSGILTDRDIAIRVVAEGKDPSSCTCSDACTSELQTISPDSSIDEAISTMRESAVRRLPVVDGKTVVGVVSLGDLAQDRDEKSVLAQISSAPSQD